MLATIQYMSGIMGLLQKKGLMWHAVSICMGTELNSKCCFLNFVCRFNQYMTYTVAKRPNKGPLTFILSIPGYLTINNVETRKQPMTYAVAKKPKEDPLTFVFSIPEYLTINYVNVWLKTTYLSWKVYSSILIFFLHFITEKSSRTTFDGASIL